MPTLFTIGHSSRSIHSFIALLKHTGIQAVVDVRSLPRSRSHPHFDQHHLPALLAEHGIEYVHIAALGGRRPREPDVDPTINAYWTNRSFHNYADYALSEPFRQGLQTLVEFGRTRRCAIMCAEAVWWRCHRRIITDYLIRRRCKVRHILSPGKITEGSLTPGAVLTPGGLHYPRSDGLARPSPHKRTPHAALQIP